MKHQKINELVISKNLLAVSVVALPRGKVWLGDVCLRMSVGLQDTSRCSDLLIMVMIDS